MGEQKSTDENVTSPCPYYNDESDQNRGKSSRTESEDFIFYSITISFLLLSFLVAMVTKDLGVVLSLVGCTGSTLVTFVLPGLFFLKVHPCADVLWALAWLQLSVGLIIMPLALYYIFSNQI